MKLGVAYAANREEFDAQLGQFTDAAYPLLLQQRIVGPGAGIFVLLWDDELLAVFAHRRIREKAPGRGPGGRPGARMDHRVLECDRFKFLLFETFKPSQLYS